MHLIDYPHYKPTGKKINPEYEYSVAFQVLCACLYFICFIRKVLNLVVQ